ncbi:MAG: tetratricopeptide repeat protein [Treponema sp.]|nr:tetratricopeptide repeat protein [Treponema sp.]
MMKNYKKVTYILFCFLLSVKCFALEFSLRADPQAILPFLSGGANKYAPAGMGGFIDAGVIFLDMIDVGPEVGIFWVPKLDSEKLMDGQDKAALFVPFGVHTDFTFYPFSRLSTTVGLAAGAYVGTSSKNTQNSVYYRAYADAAFRITPMISVGANVSILDFQNTTWFPWQDTEHNPGCAGLTAGVTVKFKFDTVKNAGEVEGYVTQDESVFPLFYTVYKNVPVGTITIVNNETAGINNINVKFRAQGYTSSEMECGKVKSLRKHAATEIDMYADFNENILQFAEAGKIPGELVVEYELLGQKRYSVTPVIIPVYNRNQVRWTDNEVIASYISTKSQEVLEFSKNIVGIARNHLRSGLNRNMQFAMYLFEGIRLAGITCSADSDTPYVKAHADPSALDYIQYPFQTMIYKSGDADEIGILLMALLESVGIEAAYIPAKDDFLVCFNTGIKGTKADSFFDGYDRFFVIGEDVWIPLAMSTLREGFVNCWYKAIIDLQTTADSGEDIQIVSLSDAWTNYPPAGFSSGQDVEIKPEESELVAAAETDISRYITTEFGPRIAAVQAQIRANGPSIELYNQLGLLYVRAGMYSSAIPVYSESAKYGSTSAMNNLGNICSLQKKYEEALAWYEKTLELDPENKTALKGVARMKSEIEK